jgi:hypothetical protein
MSSRLELRRHTISACMAVALLGAGCAGAPPRAERYIAPPMGSSWTYSTVSTGSYGSGSGQVTLRLGEATWDGRKVYSFQSPAVHSLQDENSALLAVTAPNGTVQARFDPPIGYRFPLEVGKAWSQEHTTTTVATGQKIGFTATWKVEAYEDVTVPAGTFKAWRIAYSDTTGESMTLWSAPEKLGVFIKRNQERSASYRLGPGTRSMELLTVPALK